MRIWGADGRGVALLVAVLSAVAGAATAAPQIGRRGDVFTINGQAKFLLMVSYFDGLDAGASNWARDFSWLQQRGIDGVRVFPNWWQQVRTCDSNTVVTVSDAAAPSFVNQGRLDTLKSLISIAGNYNLIVEVALSRETVCGMPAFPALPEAPERQRYLIGVASLASQLQPYSNVIVDLQNEWNVVFGGEGSVPLSHVNEIRDAVRSQHPSRLLVASMDQFGTPSVAASTTVTHGLDALGYHERRDDGSWFGSLLREKIRDLRLALGSTRAPIYLNEPRHWQHGEADPVQNRAEFRAAIREAKYHGAAGWTFHTERSFYLGGHVPQRALIDAMSAEEANTLATLREYEGARWGVSTYEAQSRPSASSTTLSISLVGTR